MNKTQMKLIESAKKNGFVWVDSDKSRSVKAVQSLVKLGKLVEDTGRSIRGSDFTSRYYRVS